MSAVIDCRPVLVFFLFGDLLKGIFMGKENDIIYELSKIDEHFDKLGSSSAEIRRFISILSIVYDAINSAIGAILITDGKGNIVFANPAFLKMFLFKDFKELSRIKVRDLFEQEEINTLFDVKGIIDTGDTGSSEFSVINKDGESFFVEIACSDIFKNGKLVGKIGSFTNISKRKKLETEREKLILKLQDALAQIKTLKGLIPICSYCKNIRDDAGYWRQLEAYVSKYSEAKFSHGICPECLKKHFPQFSDKMLKKND